MTPRRALAFACIALLSGTLAVETPAQAQVQDDEFLKGAHRPGGGVSSPAVLKEVKPAYTQEAMRQKIQGEVELQVVVGSDGNVDRARVIRSLDKEYGLDAQALQAASQWKFRPGTLDGKAVPVVVTLLLEFKLHCSGPACAESSFQPQFSLQRPVAEEEFLKGTYTPGTAGVRPPAVVREVKPSYTPEAMRQKIQGAVELQIVVGADGSVERARVTKSLDTVYGLDAAALETAAQWRFRPGTLEGLPVPVVVTLQLQFRLSK